MNTPRGTALGVKHWFPAVTEQLDRNQALFAILSHQGSAILWKLSVRLPPWTCLLIFSVVEVNFSLVKLVAESLLIQSRGSWR